MSKTLFFKSQYSFLQSMCTIEKIVEKAKADNYDSICIIDNNTLSGAVEFQKTCKNYNIKPNFGVSFVVKDHENDYNMCLIAQNDIGYQNLLKLVSEINLSQDKKVDILTLNKYKNNNFLFDINPINDINDIKHKKSIFNEYYAGLDKNDTSLINVCEKENVSCVALPIFNGIENIDKNRLEALKAIDNKALLIDIGSIDFSQYLSKDKMDKVFNFSENFLIDKLLNNCNCDLNLKTSLPHFTNGTKLSNADFLSLACINGLKAKLNTNNLPQEYINRLKTELDVINKMGFADYFLIVSDIVGFCKKNEIPVGRGRGSCTGSLVSYALDITAFDPLPNNLLFERFLNPERITMPDIDIDVSMKQRDKVLEYMSNKYGSDCVAHVQTASTLKSRKSLDDIARVLGYPPRFMDNVKAKLPLDAKTLIEAYNSSKSFKEIVDSSVDYKKIFDIAKDIEGLPRDTSTHASAIAIAATPLTNTVSLSTSVDDIPSIEYNAKYLEDLGIIKFDILGLNTLDVIRDTEKLIKERHPEFNGINYEHTKYQEKTFKDLFSQGRTLGVFQFASTGMRKVLKNMQPENLADLSAAVALYRPGPLAFIPEYIKNKENPSQINYELPVLEKNLKETYGVMIYQEQAMNISKDMAGFSLGKADILRKAMAKKDPVKMQELKQEFIDGSVNNGYSKEEAEKVFGKIESFASYGFNKSHAVAYADLAYRTAFLKANFPIEFYQAAIINEPNKDTKKELCKECESFIKNIKTPDVKTKLEDFIKEQTTPKERKKKSKIEVEPDKNIENNPEPGC